MNCSKCRKAYVSVNLDVDEEGAIQPRLIRWKDGLIFQIDQILYKCRATSKKVGGGGIRYTVMIRGKESFLFHEAASRMTGLSDDKLREHLYDAVERVLVYDTETIEVVWKFNESKIDTDENIGVAN